MLESALKSALKAAGFGAGLVVATFIVVYLIVLYDTVAEAQEKIAYQEAYDSLQEVEVTAVRKEAIIMKPTLEEKLNEKLDEAMVAVMPKAKGPHDLRKSVYSCLDLVRKKYAPTEPKFVSHDSGAKVIAKDLVLTIQNFSLLDLGVATKEYYAVCTTDPDGKTALEVVLRR